MNEGPCINQDNNVFTGGLSKFICLFQNPFSQIIYLCHKLIEERLGGYPGNIGRAYENHSSLLEQTITLILIYSHLTHS